MAKKQIQKTKQQPTQQPVQQTAQQPTQQTTQQQPAKKSNAIYWVCGCLTCCGIVLLIVVLFWVLSWYGVIAPGLMPAIFGG